MKIFVKIEFVVILLVMVEEIFVISNVRVKMILVWLFSNGLSNDFVCCNFFIGVWVWKKVVVVSKIMVLLMVYFIIMENKVL